MSPPLHQRLSEVITHVTGLSPTPITDLTRLPAHEPVALTETLTARLPARCAVTGTLERRLLFAEHADGRTWTIADLSGQPLGTRSWPEWTRQRLTIDAPERWLSTGTVTDEGVHRLLRPTILLAALYHPEWFPLPRFCLSVSDLARAARATLSGQVRLVDMQLGIGLDELITMVHTQRPDIVGVSATFGQHDLMIGFLDHLTSLPDPPLLLAGGSLTARNERILLDRYPTVLVARAAGEPTIADVIAHFHGDLPLDRVRGLAYRRAPRDGAPATGSVIRRTPTVGNRAQADFLPELDLLEATFAHQGVAQLETSRGCTNYCSFCPRGHKGVWAGGPPQALPAILRAMGEVFDRHPGLSRTLYLVDEEFIGRDPDAVSRALAVADTLHTARFRWESSCRIDQVVDPARDRAWHLRRAAMWRGLLARGLRRMLFGVESGVTSILARFAKETTGEQNALAIRTLSALGVPTRFTYITFDHLMTLEELTATCAFQARTDLLLRPLPHLSVAEIVDGVRDEAFVATHTTGQPFYREISYLLVSMEPLLGAAYTRAVQAAGLAGAPRPSMGRLDARFADWRIGRLSHHAQLWVDRHFTLDYTLKSLEKLLDGPPRQAARQARMVIKDAAFAFLARALGLLEGHLLDHPDEPTLDAALRTAMDDQLDHLRTAMAPTVENLWSVLPAHATVLLDREHRRWRATDRWRLINAADPCGT